MNSRNKYRIVAMGLLMTAYMAAEADIVAHFDMSVADGMITESVSGMKYPVMGNFSPENVPGAVGNALRFDGYTSHISAGTGDIIPAGSRDMTVSLWVATPSYPIIQIDTDTPEKTPIVSCLDKDSKSGFGFFIGFDGKYSFNTYVGGWPVNVEVDSPMPTYRWNNLVAVINGADRSVKLYNNGEIVGSGKANGNVSLSAGTLYMGQGTESRMAGPFQLMSFNGLIDDVTIWNEALQVTEICSWKPANTADLDIPASRFADDMLRPRFHGMPAAGWTNECHGMFFADGRYHLFFQKNADGPFMARLHWGHISSENLYDWREEKTALAPGDPYDIKGCWSGCVFADDVITGGKPNIIYTAVDYVKASIAQAYPTDESLSDWVKVADNPIIAGRPDGLSDDFRDPYFFRNGNEAYIITGSSINGIGTTTRHRYDAASKSWVNNGDLFFSGSSAAADGKFWEMPNVTRMPGGKWLFTATPLATLQGVRTLYWTGDIGADGKFVPDASSAAPRMVEMNSRDGFGMLSPTIYQHDGKTIALGIVPDKLPAEENWKLGWAHCYSLPREWSLDADGSLIQKPFAGLAGLRGTTSWSKADFNLSGTLDLSPVAGRAVEILAEFEVGVDTFGFNIFSDGQEKANVYYDPAAAEIVADFSALQRLVNDERTYNGVYRCPLGFRPTAGSLLKLNIFVDHSIIDIFVNDTRATSIRVFPTGRDNNGVEAFANGNVKVRDMKAWILDAGNSGIEPSYSEDTDALVDVYNMQGLKIKAGVDPRLATDSLPPALYIIGGRKVLVSR